MMHFFAGSILLICALASTAQAQPRIAVYVDLDVASDTNQLVSGDLLIWAGMQFDLVVFAEGLSEGFSGGDFYITPIAAPGVYELTATIYDGSTYYYSAAPGEFQFLMPGCETSPSAEFYRRRLATFGGIIPPSIVYLAGTAASPSDAEQPSLKRCDGSWDTFVFATPGGCTILGTRPPGSLSLNAYCPEGANDPASISMIKSRF